jgi:formate hydrogenlyase subunit 3/multisubunit Na+/H+ antiporter MnhD subunit
MSTESRTTTASTRPQRSTREGIAAPPAATHGRGPSRRRVRALLRALHLAVGVLLAVYVYLPETFPGREAARWFLMVGGIPLIGLSGLVIWKQAAIGRLLTRRT